MKTTNQQAPLQPSSTTGKSTLFLDNLLLLIEQNYRKSEFGVQQLAQHMQLSRVQLNRKAYNLTGQSAGKLIMDHKMNIAKQLLKESDKPIKEVAWECGFEYQANFCRCFNLTFSCSPSSYRNNFSVEEKQFSWKIPLSEHDYMYLLIMAQKKGWLRLLLNGVINNISSETLSIKQLASITCLSTCSLNRKAKKMFGVTPQKLIRDIRLQYASELITTNWGSVSDVAYKSGFYDPAHFCRSFKNAYGCQPSQYKCDTISHTSIKWLENNLMYQNDK